MHCSVFKLFATDEDHASRNYHREEETEMHIKYQKHVVIGQKSQLLRAVFLALERVFGAEEGAAGLERVETKKTNHVVIFNRNRSRRFSGVLK